MTKGIRGAITVEANSENAIKTATVELLTEIMKQNNIVKEDISHAIFTVTTDLNAAFPAKFARLNLGWDKVAMMCYNELDVPNSRRMCLRVLIVVNCDKNFIPRFVYLKGANNLRSN